MSARPPIKSPLAAPAASIRMGQMAVAKDGQQLRSLLGSCVGVALYDQRHAIGGLAHIVLPDSGGNLQFPGKFVDSAIPHLIKEIHQLAGGNVRLVAKLAGGASMFKTQSAIQIGERNVEAALLLLGEIGIPVRAQHCGGEQGRKMTLDTTSGTVTIEIVGRAKIEL